MATLALFHRYTTATAEQKLCEAVGAPLNKKGPHGQGHAWGMPQDRTQKRYMVPGTTMGNPPTVPEAQQHAWEPARGMQTKAERVNVHLLSQMHHHGRLQPLAAH